MAEEKQKEEKKKSKKVKSRKKGAGVKFCPKCDGVNINYDGAGLGNWWVCNDCRYRAVNFPEKTKARKKRI